jgi:pimeloyl-ACP methyl ester carboxylesterase
VLTHLPADGRLVTVDGAGHFLHIEQPHRVAELVLEHIT